MAQADGGGSGGTVPGSGNDTGGGSTTSVCTINPSDNVSIINNLISRISDIERFLSYLVGADIYANNLAELAENIGNLLNGTLILPSGDDPNTDTIPPDEFTGTVISGNVLTIWNNGVVSFQVTPQDGIVVGALSSYLVLAPSTTVLTSLSPNLSNILYSFGPAFNTSNLASGQIDIVEHGFYEIDVHLPVDFNTTPGTNWMFVYHSNSTTGVIEQVADVEHRASATDWDARDVLSASFGFEANSGDYILIVFSGVDSLSNTFYTMGRVTLKKLKNL